jgi:hypothetical protein
MLFYLGIVGFWFVVLAAGLIIVVPAWRRDFRDSFNVGKDQSEKNFENSALADASAKVGATAAKITNLFR